MQKMPSEESLDVSRRHPRSSEMQYCLLASFPAAGSICAAQAALTLEDLGPLVLM